MTKVLKNVAALKIVLKQKEEAWRKAEAEEKKAWRALQAARKSKSENAFWTEDKCRKAHSKADDKEWAAGEAWKRAETALLREVLTLLPRATAKEAMSRWNY
jgi:hypothetical protein